MIFSITYHETYINNFCQTYHQVYLDQEHETETGLREFWELRDSLTCNCDIAYGPQSIPKRLSDFLFIAVAAGLLVIIQKERRCETIKNFGPMWGQYALDTTP